MQKNAGDVSTKMNDFKIIFLWQFHLLYRDCSMRFSNPFFHKLTALGPRYTKQNNLNFCLLFMKIFAKSQ